MNELEHFFNTPLKHISIKQLEQLVSLPLPFDSDDGVKFISAAVDELFRREDLDAVFPPIDVDRAWENFAKYYMSRTE